MTDTQHHNHMLSKSRACVASVLSMLCGGAHCIGGRRVAAKKLAATARAARGLAATACGRQQVSEQEPAGN